jgi:hypothetical protein
MLCNFCIVCIFAFVPHISKAYQHALWKLKVPSTPFVVVLLTGSRIDVSNHSSVLILNAMGYEMAAASWVSIAFCSYCLNYSCSFRFNAMFYFWIIYLVTRHSYWKFICAAWLKKSYSTPRYEALYLEYDERTWMVMYWKKKTVINLVFEVNLHPKF